MPDHTVARNVHFFRADIGQDDSGKLYPFDPAPALSAINSLPFADGTGGRYESDSEGNVLCLFCDPVLPNKLQFCRIRRTGLPQLERAGRLSELQIGMDTGLSEAIQVMFFPGNVAGIVYNHFGPRMSRLGSYLHTKSNHAIPLATFRPILNRDVSRQLEQLIDIRLFEFSVQPYSANTVKENDTALGDIVEASLRLQDPDNVVQVIATFSGDRRESMLDTVLNRVKRLLLIDDLQGIEKLRLRGKRNDTERVETIDLLRDRLVSAQHVVRLGDRSRALDPSSAFEAINNAYQVLKDDLDQGLAVEP